MCPKGSLTLNEYMCYLAVERLKQELSAIRAYFYQVPCGVFVY